MEFKL